MQNWLLLNNQNAGRMENWLLMKKNGTIGYLVNLVIWQMTTWPIFPLIFHNDLQTSISNMASSNDDTSYYLREWPRAFWKNTANRADHVSISSIFVYFPFPSLSSFLFHLPSSTLIFFIYLSLFAFQLCSECDSLQNTQWPTPNHREILFWPTPFL